MHIYLPIAEMSANVLLFLGMGGAVGFLSGLFGVGGGFLMTPLLIFIGILAGKMPETGAGDIAASVIGLGGYVIAALGYSTIYRATVQLSLWQLGAEALHLSRVERLDRVEARGEASSPLGEGLADALNVGGY